MPIPSRLSRRSRRRCPSHRSGEGLGETRGREVPKSAKPTAHARAQQGEGRGDTFETPTGPIYDKVVNRLLAFE